MSRDRFDELLKQKLDGEIGPPADLWKRIEAEMALRDASDRQSVSLSRRRLHMRYMAAAVLLGGILIAGVVGSLYYVESRQPILETELLPVPNDDTTQQNVPYGEKYVDRSESIIDNIIAKNDQISQAGDQVASTLSELNRTVLETERDQESASSSSDESVIGIESASNGSPVLAVAVQSAAVVETTAQIPPSHIADPVSEGEREQGIAHIQSEPVSVQRTKAVSEEVARDHRYSSVRSHVWEADEFAASDSRTLRASDAGSQTHTRRQKRSVAQSDGHLASGNNNNWAMRVYASGLGGTSEINRTGASATKMMGEIGIEEQYDRQHIYASSSAGPNISLDHKMPISAGVTGRWRFATRFGLEMGIVYTYLESNAKANRNGMFDYRVKQQLHYLGLPVSLVYTVFERRRFELFARGGVMLEQCVSAIQERRVGSMNGEFGEAERIDLDRGDVQFSAGLGFGGSYRFAGPVSVYLEPGVHYYAESNQPESYRTEHPWNFSVRAGFRFDF